MALYDQIIELLPELGEKIEEFGVNGSIRLQDDADGYGEYIAKWNYAKPLPKSLKLGK